MTFQRGLSVTWGVSIYKTFEAYLISHNWGKNSFLEYFLESGHMYIKMKYFIFIKIPN